MTAMASSPTSTSLTLESEDLSSSSSEEYDPDLAELEDIEPDYPNTPEIVKRRKKLTLLKNYVISTLWHFGSKMLTSMSYSQPEVFAHNLRSRLEDLEDSDVPNEAVRTATAKNPRLKQFLEKHIAGPLLGTTFPPSRMLQMESRPSWHSESDLSGFATSSDHHPNDQKHEKIEEETEGCQTTTVEDSDLFFDFDFNSPEDGTNDEISPASSLTQNSPPDSIIRDSETSTTFGSTSSGLYSDTEKLELEDLTEQHFSLDPAEWSSFNDILQKTTEVTPLASPAPAQDEQSSSDTTVDGSETEQKSTIFIGDKEKQIATSKLSSLLCLLEKDREYKSVPSGGHSKSSLKALEEPQIVQQHKCGTSPANFSFLENALENNTRIERAHSTSFINDIKKTHTKMTEESQYSASVGTALKVKPEPLLEEAEDTKAKYRRCSSLKSGKTPPGTPGRRKIVRFADVFGLEIADVKTFLDEVPKVPKSAFKDLKDAELSDLDSDSGSERTFPVLPPSGPPKVLHRNTPVATPTFSPLFSQPSGSPDFFNRLRDKKVSLESAYMCDITTVKGIVRVVNLDFHKKVLVKYTTDEWSTCHEAQGAYMPGSCDGFSDKFVFTLDISAIKGAVGKKVHFCICYVCSSNEYWDNNQNRNYTFQCFGAPSVKKITGLPTAAVMSKVLPPTYQRPSTTAHYGMSQSPSTLEDPWQRYL